MRWGLLPFSEWGNWDLERLCHLPEVPTASKWQSQAFSSFLSDPSEVQTQSHRGSGGRGQEGGDHLMGPWKVDTLLLPLSPCIKRRFRAGTARQVGQAYAQLQGRGETWKRRKHRELKILILSSVKYFARSTNKAGNLINLCVCMCT